MTHPQNRDTAILRPNKQPKPFACLTILSERWMRGCRRNDFCSPPSHEPFRADKQAPKPFCQPALRETEAWKQFYLSLLRLRPSLNKHRHQNLFLAEAEQILPLIRYHLKFSEFHLPSEMLLSSAKALDSMLHTWGTLHSERQHSPSPTPPSKTTGHFGSLTLETRDSCRDRVPSEHKKSWLWFLHIAVEKITEPWTGKARNPLTMLWVLQKQ